MLLYAADWASSTTARAHSGSPHNIQPPMFKADVGVDRTGYFHDHPRVGDARISAHKGVGADNITFFRHPHRVFVSPRDQMFQ